MIKETIAAIDLHFNRAKMTYAEIKLFEDNLNNATFQDAEKIKTIDSFIFRYIKIQDLMGDKLFKEFLTLVGDYKSTMTMLDILDKLEKLEIIDDAASWMIYRNLRNTLTHEYPDNEDEIIEGIKTALNVFLELQRIYQKIVAYLQTKSLC